MLEASVSSADTEKRPREKKYRDGDPRRNKPKNKRRTARNIAGIVLLIILALIFTVGVYAYHYDAIFPNIYVNDENLGGKTAEEALAILNDTYYAEKIRDITIPVICEDARDEISLNNLQVDYLNQEVVGNALEKSTYHNPISKTVAFLFRVLHRTELEPVIHYQNQLLLEKLDQIASPYEIEPVGYTFKIEPESVTLYGKVNGVKADRQTIVEEIEKQMKTLAFSQVAMVPEKVTPEALQFDEFYTWLTGAAQNAYYEKNQDGKVVVHPEKLQCIVDPETVKEALKAVDQSPDNTTTFAVKTSPPEETGTMLQERLYQDTLGSYSTWYGGSAARVNNVRLAVSRINGREMMPEEEFSYDKTILPRNAANGYQAAPVYVGNKVESGMGGGICQPSSTLYCAALYANLQILERHNHSLTVSYMPPGLDATIAEGYMDLRLKNNTGYPIRIDADSAGGKVTFTIRGYNPEHYSVELLRSGGGYVYDVTRVVKKDGAEVTREKMSSSHYQPPAPSETPKPSAAPKNEEKPQTPAATETPKAAETAAPAAAETAAPASAEPKTSHTSEAGSSAEEQNE